MVIVRILKRRGSLREVQFDDGTYILLDKRYCEELSLCEGQTLSEDQADTYEITSDALRCKNRALYYLSIGDCSEKALKEKLTRAGFEANAVQKTLARLKELSLLDDVRVSRRFFEQADEAHLSRRELLAKAGQKGLDVAYLKECLEERPTWDDEQAVRLLCGRYASRLDDEQSIAKTVAALQRKGFSFSSIHTALKQVAEELNSE